MTRTHQPSTPTFPRLETLAVVAVVGVLALLLGIFALSRPTHVAERHSVDYTQGGSFGYRAPGDPRTVYGTEGLRTGEPILGNALSAVTVSFDYALRGPRPAKVRGTGSLTARVTFPEGFSRDFEIVSGQPFHGIRTSLSGTLPLPAILAYVQHTQSALGALTTGATATMTLIPRIAVHGALEGHRLASSYRASLPFTVSGATLTPASQTGTPPRLEPRRGGSLHYSSLTANTMPLLVAHPGVAIVRWVALAIAALCLLLFVWLVRPLLRGDGADRSDRIRSLYGSRIVEVAGLSNCEGPVADVSSIDALAELAKRYESMIMHSSDPDSYLVWDQGMLYRYRPAAVRPVADLSEKRPSHLGRG